MTILVLEDSDYTEKAESLVLQPVKGNGLTDLVEKSQTTKRTIWLERTREWVRNILRGEDWVR
jgi:hypothetical protein